jgi:hypothetical protein
MVTFRRWERNQFLEDKGLLGRIQAGMMQETAQLSLIIQEFLIYERMAINSAGSRQICTDRKILAESIC